MPMPTLITHEKLDSVRRLVLLSIALQLLTVLTFATYFALKDHNAETERNINMNLNVGKKAGE